MLLLSGWTAVVFVLCINCHQVVLKGEECHGLVYHWASVERGRITVMDWGPVDNTCVNTVCLSAEPCSPGVSSVFLRDLSSMASSHIAPQEEEGPWTLKEKSVPAKGGKTQLAPGTSAGPSHAWLDGAETCLCQEACHDSPITGDTSPKTYSWERKNSRGDLNKGRVETIYTVEMEINSHWVWRSPCSSCHYKLVFNHKQ